MGDQLRQEPCKLDELLLVGLGDPLLLELDQESLYHDACLLVEVLELQVETQHLQDFLLLSQHLVPSKLPPRGVGQDLVHEDGDDVF